MKGPCPEKLAHSLIPSSPKLALDLLRACGYTRRAAERKVREHEGEAASSACCNTKGTTQ